jgi:hypothetical protein
MVPGIPNALECDAGFICREGQCVPEAFADRQWPLNAPVMAVPVITDPELYAHGSALRNAGAALTVVAALSDVAGVALLLYYDSRPPPGPRDCWCDGLGYAWGGHRAPRIERAITGCGHSPLGARRTHYGERAIDADCRKALALRCSDLGRIRSRRSRWLVLNERSRISR